MTRQMQTLWPELKSERHESQVSTAAHVQPLMWRADKLFLQGCPPKGAKPALPGDEGLHLYGALCPSLILILLVLTRPALQFVSAPAV